MATPPNRAAPVALVAGAAQGIGRAVTEERLAAGARVLALDVDAAALEDLLERARARGDADRLVPLLGDVADEAAVRGAVAAAVAAFGRLDQVAYVAGIGAFVPLAELDLTTWRRVLDVNLTGAYLVARAAAPHLAAARGALVVIASTRAHQSEPHGEAYAASKGGLLALTHALAVSLGPAVRVNAVSPGWIEVGDRRPAATARPVDHGDADRDQHPVGRVGVPEDVAAAVAYLCSDAAGFVTGQELVVDGGMTRRMRYV
jgi:NAD(P)-dependent dehydrogenase (short-subunit alcohol dehydrogenase family)